MEQEEEETFKFLMNTFVNYLAVGLSALVLTLTMNLGTQIEEQKQTLTQKQGDQYPPQRKWCFWFLNNGVANIWTDNLANLAMFDTVEDYCGLYQNIKQPSELKIRQDYAVFKRGISPMWEDPANNNGGRWLLHLDTTNGDLDRFWHDVVVLMLEESFGKLSDTVCGAAVHIRPNLNKISLWTRTLDEDTNMAVGQRIKERLQISSEMQYCIHGTKGLKTDGAILFFYIRNKLHGKSPLKLPTRY